MPFPTMHKNDVANVAKEVELERKEIYDDIVFDYSAIKTNVFGKEHLDPEFFKAVGNVEGCSLLDLACGSGYYTKLLKQKGASEVIGVDISEGMIKEADKDELEHSLGITYVVGDASKYVHGHEMDVVTGAFLLCYADSEENLLKFCENIYANLKCGGKFVTMQPVLDETCNLEDMTLGYTFVPYVNEKKPDTLYDGVQVDVTIYSADFKSKCSFPSFLWKSQTISKLLYAVGFEDVKIVPILTGTPYMITVATKQ